MDNSVANYEEYWEQFVKNLGWQIYHINQGSAGSSIELIKEFDVNYQSDVLVMISPVYEMVSIYPLGDRYANKKDYLANKGKFNGENYIAVLDEKEVHFVPFLHDDIVEIEKVFRETLKLCEHYSFSPN